MADDFSDFQSKTKNLFQFKEKVLSLFKKYFQLKNYIVIDKNEKGEFEIIQKEGPKVEDIFLTLEKNSLEIKIDFA